MKFEIRKVQAAETARSNPFLALLERFPSGDAARLLEPESPSGRFDVMQYVVSGDARSHDPSGRLGLIRTGGLEWLGADGTISDVLRASATPDVGAHTITIWLRAQPDVRPSPVRYQAFDAAQLPVYERRGSWVRTLAGTFDGARSPLAHAGAAFVAHVRLEARADVAFPLDAGATTLVYALSGSAQIGPLRIVAGEVASSRDARSYVALGAQSSKFEALVLSAVAIPDAAAFDSGALSFAKLAAIV